MKILNKNVLIKQKWLSVKLHLLLPALLTANPTTPHARTAVGLKVTGAPNGISEQLLSGGMLGVQAL